MFREIPAGKVRFMLIGREAGGFEAGDRLRKVGVGVVVQDADIVLKTFTTLQQGEPVEGRDLLLVAGRPVLFLDSNFDVVCAFLYWPASRPPNIFEPYHAILRGPDYYMGKPILSHAQARYETGRGLVVKASFQVPDFDKMIADHFDVHK